MRPADAALRPSGPSPKPRRTRNLWGPSASAPRRACRRRPEITPWALAVSGMLGSWVRAAPAFLENGSPNERATVFRVVKLQSLSFERPLRMFTPKPRAWKPGKRNQARLLHLTKDAACEGVGPATAACG